MSLFFADKRYGVFFASIRKGIKLRNMNIQTTGSFGDLILHLSISLSNIYHHQIIMKHWHDDGEKSNLIMSLWYSPSSLALCISLCIVYPFLQLYPSLDPSTGLRCDQSNYNQHYHVDIFYGIKCIFLKSMFCITNLETQ